MRLPIKFCIAREVPVRSVWKETLSQVHPGPGTLPAGRMKAGGDALLNRNTVSC